MNGRCMQPCIPLLIESTAATHRKLIYSIHRTAGLHRQRLSLCVSHQLGQPLICVGAGCCRVAKTRSLGPVPRQQLLGAAMQRARAKRARTRLQTLHPPTPRPPQAQLEGDSWLLLLLHRAAAVRSQLLWLLTRQPRARHRQVLCLGGNSTTAEGTDAEGPSPALAQAGRASKGMAPMSPGQSTSSSTAAPATPEQTPAKEASSVLASRPASGALRAALAAASGSSPASQAAQVAKTPGRVFGYKSNNVEHASNSPGKRLTMLPV